MFHYPAFAILANAGEFLAGPSKTPTSSPSPYIKLTYGDYLLSPEDANRHELIDGEHYVTDPPDVKEQKVAATLHGLLDAHLKQSKAGQLFTAPTAVMLSDCDVVQPDLLVVSAVRSSIIVGKTVRGAPDLVVEISSETTRKTHELIKRKLYEHHRVLEYWIVDPEEGTVRVYRLSGQSFVRAAGLGREIGDILSTPLFPDLQIPLTRIFD